MSALKIIFMGTPDFSVTALECLIQAGHEIVAVYAQPPRKAGRGMSERLSPVHQFAQSHGLPVLTPVNFKDPATVSTFVGHGADVAVVVAYGLILPKDVLAAPKHGCLNIHASLLPRWRGAAPIQRAIMAGDETTGVTIMQMDEGLDTGDIVLAEPVGITQNTTAGSLHDGLRDLGGTLIVTALADLEKAQLTPEPQDDDKTTYAAKITKAEGRINWQHTASDIDRQIRGLTPWPGAWFEAVNGDKKVRIKIKKAGLANGSGAPGEVLDGDLRIACAKGAIHIEEVQREGKSPAKTQDFLRGFTLSPGTILE